MLRASETLRCHAESRYFGIDFVEASLCIFIPSVSEIPQPQRNDFSNGIKVRPGNGSGVERGGGFCKRYHMSHAEGVANCIAWQFHPRGTHRVRLFSLDFLWFFLVSRQERTCKPLFAMLFCCDATFQCCSLEKLLRASLF